MGSSMQVINEFNPNAARQARQRHARKMRRRGLSLLAFATICIIIILTK